MLLLPSCQGLAYERFGLNLSTAALPAGYTYQPDPQGARMRWLDHSPMTVPENDVAMRICVDADGPGTIFPEWHLV